MVAAVTEAVLNGNFGLNADENRYSRDPYRVWVMPTEVPDGSWGAAGRIFRLADIVAFATGDREQAERYADTRLGRDRDARIPA